jgi:hypothetical protein
LRSGNVRELKGATLSDIIRREAQGLKRRRKKGARDLQRSIRRLFGKELQSRFLDWRYLQTFGDFKYDIRRYRILSEADVSIPARLYLPKIPKREKFGTLFLCIGPGANRRGLEANSIQRRLADAGCVSMTADLRGWGEAKGDIDMPSMSQYLTEDCYYEFCYMMLGESYLGNRVRDAVAVMRFIEKRKAELELPRKVVIIGNGSGAWVAAIAAALSNKVKGLVLREFLPSYEMLFEDNEYRIPADIFAFGAYSAFDLGELLRTGGKRKVIVESAVDQMGRPLSSARLMQRGLIYRKRPLSVRSFKEIFG